MNNQLSAIMFNIICKGIGVNVNEELKKLNESQYWDVKKIYQDRFQALTECIEFTRQNSNYYSKSLSNLAKIDSMDDFINLPILTKKQIRENLNNIFVEKPNMSYLSFSTSGSTGIPLNIRINKEAYAKHFAAKYRALKWYGVNFSDRQARLWGLTLESKERIYWRIRDFIQNRVRFVAYEPDPNKLLSFYRKCCHFKPTYINGYTSSIHRFAIFIINNNLDIQKLTTKVVLPTAEMLYPHQRNDIKTAFNCPVMDEYGCNEIPGIAYECEAGNLHINHENMIFELLDDKGEPIPYEKDQIGRVTITPIFYRSMPLIRYQNGDLASWSGVESCPCGRQPGLPTLKKIIGRMVDKIVDESGNESNWTIIYYAVKKVFDDHIVNEFQVIQRSKTHIHFNIVPGNEFTQDAISKIQERIRPVLGNSVYVTYELMDLIPRSESGKFKYFISELENSKKNESSI
jgi:phenylacetate-CoA ligase